MADENPLIDTSNVTVSAFNAIKNEEKKNKVNITLGKTDTTTWKSPNFKVKIKAWTSTDNKTHTYFHSMSIDVNVEDFMGTAELKCPYDSDLMAYWEPIRQTVVIYGANKGDYKILFIGRVRGVKQDGYELVVEFQNYGWKFKQLVTQSYANDNVLNKDGYTIMRLMFEALKIDSYVISTSARNRLKQVGINQDGNLTMNGQELEKMPDLLKRLEKSDPSKLVNKSSLNNKLKEKYLHNIKNINYTLKYEKPTKVMQKIASEGSYSGGENIYDTPYGSIGDAVGGAAGAIGGALGAAANGAGGGGCNDPGNPKSWGNNCAGVYTPVFDALRTVYKFNRGCVDGYTEAKQSFGSQARSAPSAYLSTTHPCLEVLEKYCIRGDGINAATDCKNYAWQQAQLTNVNKYTGSIQRQAGSTYKNLMSTARQGYNALDKMSGGLISKGWNALSSLWGR